MFVRNIRGISGRHHIICHPERQRRIFNLKMLHFVQHDNEGHLLLLQRLGRVGAGGAECLPED